MRLTTAGGAPLIREMEIHAQHGTKLFSPLSI
jgi:hypothetical protein